MCLFSSTSNSSSRSSICVIYYLFCFCLGVGVRGGWWDRSPEFGPALDRVTVLEGETARLPCVVMNLSDRSVTWLRRRDLHILTAGHHTYSADQRFKVAHTEGSNQWTLVLSFAQMRDAGIYDCQVNTHHKLSRPVTLTVLDPRLQRTKTKVFVANNTASTKDGHLKVEILGPRELYIEKGSSLSLTCLVTSSDKPSTLVYWYHDTSLIDYNSPRGGVNLKIDRGRGETTTRLVVSSVGPGDSGMYSCVPEGSHPATVLVHVQKGDHEAAIQQGPGLNNHCSTTEVLHHLPLILSYVVLYLPHLSISLHVRHCSYLVLLLCPTMVYMFLAPLVDVTLPVSHIESFSPVRCLDCSLFLHVISIPFSISISST